MSKAGSERLAAVDRAFEYLASKNGFHPRTTIAIAIRVEFFLAVRWEDKQEELRRRRDPNVWAEISIPAMGRIRELFARTPPGLSNAAAEQHVIELLTKLRRPDIAWSTAQQLRIELGCWLRRRIPEPGVLQNESPS